jgi:hypothetical protein
MMCTLPGGLGPADLAMIAGLGAFHGLNPAMGWLFAVALGLQQRDRGAVTRALGPITLGHAVAVVAALALLRVMEVSVPQRVVAWVVAAGLIGFGLTKLIRQRHPRWVGMRVNARQLALWSFVMASVHGAGLMLYPVMIRADRAAQQGGASAPDQTVQLASMLPGGATSAAALVHTVAMLAVMATVALVVYHVVGVAVLRRAWVNVDILWAAALLAGGVFVLVA